MFYIICKVKNDNTPSHLRYWIVWSEYKERKEYKTFSLNIHPDNFKFGFNKLETFHKSEVTVFHIKKSFMDIITKINEFINSDEKEMKLFNKTFIKFEDKIKVIREDGVSGIFFTNKMTYEDIVFFALKPNMVKI